MGVLRRIRRITTMKTFTLYNSQFHNFFGSLFYYTLFTFYYNNTATGNGFREDARIMPLWKEVGEFVVPVSTCERTRRDIPSYPTLLSPNSIFSFFLPKSLRKMLSPTFAAGQGKSRYVLGH